MDVVPALSLDTIPYPLDEQSLRDEVKSLTAAIDEANEERAQAAEYGLVLLSEKQALRSQYDELSGLYESTKRELENSVDAIKQVQADYEKRLRVVESQREQLLDEMETRETSLIAKVDKLGEEIRQLERKLKQSTSEQEHLNGHNTFLNAELDRHRRECDVLREENSRLKQQQFTANRERDDMKKDNEKLEKRIQKLLKFEEECSVLQEMNQTLAQESESQSHQYELILTEKEELENQAKQVVEALNEEREAKSILETKLQEEEMRSPAHPSWAIERESASPPPPLSSSKRNSIKTTPDHTRLTSLSPTQRDGSLEPNMQSTPYSPKRMPNLLSELQNSFMGNVDSAELETLQQRCQEAENTITSLQKEKLVLEEKVSSFSLEKTETFARIDSVKEEYAKAISERDILISSLKEDVLTKEEAIGRLRNRLNSASAEKSSKEIEIEGLKDELQHIKESSVCDMEKAQKEYIEEQAKNAELRGEVSVLEEQLVCFSNTVEKLENIIFSSQTELTLMADDLHNLHKTVVTLGSENKRGGPSPSPNTLVGNNIAPNLSNEDDSLNPFYSIKLVKRKTSVPVHHESQSLFAIVQLHQQLRSMRLPLEHFTKTMLEKSLAHSAAKRVPSGSASPTLGAAGDKKTNLDLEASVNKWKAKLAHKIEEISNLRAIMKARSTTSDVAISSLRSKLEGQARAYQTELTRLKHQLKMLRKEKDEQLSLRTLYAKRCEEYANEITKLKREIDSKAIQYEDVMILLKKTIQRKLELATELDEYRMEQERLHLIPKLLGSSRI